MENFFIISDAAYSLGFHGNLESEFVRDIVGYCKAASSTFLIRIVAGNFVVNKKGRIAVAMKLGFLQSSKVDLVCF